MNEGRLNELLGKMVGDMGAASVAPLVVLGDKLGLYRALAAKGPMTTDELAAQTQTHERYVREWCAAQAGSGYIAYHAGEQTFSMTPEQQAVFADADVGLALGAQAGEKRLKAVVTEGGFQRFRRATQTPFNLILEARP